MSQGNALTPIDTEVNKVNLTGEPAYLVAVFAFKTISANPSVALIPVAYLTDEILSRAWATVKHILFKNIF